MTGPDDIDALVVARRVLANPKTCRVSAFEEQALAGCLVALDAQLDAIEAVPVVRASLAAAIAKFIEIETLFVEEAKSEVFASDEIFHRRDRAFHALKNAFEQEFPHV